MANSSKIKSLKKYNEAFLEELGKLNAQQKKAVEQIEGPVLVVAGPGTGKTHILTARIGRILMETDTLPQNILCLTFTDSGTHAMRKRLLEFIGPEAHRVHIYTFHSFCNNIIQDNIELFGRRDLEPLSELERVEIIRKILEELDISHPLKRGKRDMYFYESQLYDLFKRMKAEDWSTDFVNAKIDEYLNDIPHRPNFIYKRNTKENRKGDLKQWMIDAAHEKMERLRSAVTLFPDYIKALSDARRYDFEDMILWVLRAFENDQVLLKIYQERYLYFLVDEYQDTNGSQNKIIKELISYWNSPNIFIVGDDDQSIYEFQGARLKNLLNFYESYKKDLSLVLLQDNYRSSQHILDGAKIVIDHNEKRIVSALDGIEKILYAQHPDFAKTQIKPNISSYPNRIHEETDIVLQIEALQKKGFPLEEVAIIYAKHKQVKNIITLLEKKGIPYHTKRQVNILDLPLIRNLRMILQYINNEQQLPYSGEHLLFKTMHSHFLNIEITDLAKLSLFMAKHAYGNKRYWRDVIGNEELLDTFELKNKKSILQFSTLLNELIKDYHNFTVPAFLERLFNRCGILLYALQKNDKAFDLQVLNTFFDFVQKETDKNPRISIDRLLDILKSMDANRLAIGIQKTIYAEKGVKLITAHSSKGLEFQYVFIIDAVKDQWEPKNSSAAFRFPFPDTLTLSGEEDAVEARRRLFYVAMTRAKEYLHISFSENTKVGKTLQHTVFVDEMLNLDTLEIQHKELDPKLLIEAQSLQLLEVEKAQIQAYDKSQIDTLLEGFTLSVTSLNRYLRCPLSFYYENILKIPTVSSDAASFGTAMHYALKRLFDKMQLSEDKTFPSFTDFLRFFEDDLNRQKGNFTKKAFKLRLQMGRLYLSQYYQQNISTWHKNVQTEYVVRNVEYNGVPLKGAIDLVEIHNKHLHIVDYKTGSHNKQKINPPSKSKPLGGLYWRQLVFYKILYESHNSSKAVRSAEISYLQPDSKGELITKQIHFTANDLHLVGNMITDSYQKIMRHEFYNGCEEKSCAWCSFVKENVMTDSFRDLDAEELDD